MAGIGGALGNKVEVTNINVTTPTIKNLDMPAKDTEYTYALPANTKRFKIQGRAVGDIKMAFSAWAGTPDYWTIYAGQQDEELGMTAASSVTLYLQSTVNNNTAEIRTWT